MSRSVFPARRDPISAETTTRKRSHRFLALVVSALLAATPLVLAPAATAGASAASAGAVATDQLPSAGERAIVDGQLGWGVKESFRRYITGPIAHGTAEASAGATKESNGTFTFTGATGLYDANGSSFGAFAKGTVRFLGHDGALDLKISNVNLQIFGRSGVLIADVESKEYPSGIERSFPQVELATLDTSRGVTVSGNTVTLSAIPATLTDAGAPAFGGFYEAGEALDPISASLTLEAQRAPFTDVSGTPGSWNYSQFNNEITWMFTSGISTGYPIAHGQFEYRPFNAVARDAMAAFLYRAAGSPSYIAPAKSPFADVATNHPFYKEIAWLAAQGISTGWDVGGKKEFRPSASITRDAMAAFLYRFAKQPAFNPPATSPFTDVVKNESFYKEITWLASTGVTTGWDVGGKKQFRPFNAITRDAMAAFLYRFDALG